MILFAIFLVVALLSEYLGDSTPSIPGRLSPGDPSSYSRPEDSRVVHSHLVLEVDFEDQIVRGYVEILTRRSSTKTRSIILDTKDLIIKQIKNLQTDADVEYNLYGRNGNFGSMLEIDLLCCISREATLRIYYETTRNGSALLWLQKHQTADKTHPYFFTQCAPINARSFYPCQDSPSVKGTYTAEIHAPKGLNILMGANRTDLIETEDSTVAKFQQDLPIASYLMALVVGKLESRSVGPKSKVWAEPSVVERAAFEFAETGRIVEIAEEICGPYLWGQYDILVLPPAFPFGGMEIPTLTYVTPTVLAGDKSGISVIAHEVAHSWTGNLVTHFNFEHFWIKEAFTVFLERKIMGRIYGEPTRQFLALGGWKDLKDAVQGLGKNNPLTKLHLDLTGIDPTDSFSKIPYEKGSTVIWYWNELVRDTALFEEFIRHFVQVWKFKSITLDDLLETLFHFFKSNGPPDVYERLLEMNLTAWFEEPGLPPYKPQFDTSLADTCTAVALRWIDYDANTDISCPFSKHDIETMSPGQNMEFLAQLFEFPGLRNETIKCMDKSYQFSKSGNSYIKFRWMRLCIKARHIEVFSDVIAFAQSQGRIAYNQRLFRDLYDWPEMRPKAVEAYNEIKDNWMFLTSYLVGGELHLIS